MEGNIIEKIYNMIKMDILGVSLSKEDGDMKFNIYFRYDERNDVVSYEIVRTNGEIKSTNKGVVTNEEELFNLFRTYELEEVVEMVVKRRLVKESKFLEIRQKMLDSIDSMNLSDKPKAALKNLIDKTTQLSEYVGNQNRVTINKTDEIIDQVRITDDTNFGVGGENLHLQLVQTVYESSGSKYRNYPEMTFEELIGYILSSEYIIGKVHRRLGK